MKFEVHRLTVLAQLRRGVNTQQAWNCDHRPITPDVVRNGHMCVEQGTVVSIQTMGRFSGRRLTAT